MTIKQWNNLKKGDIIYTKRSGTPREVLKTYQTMEYVRTSKTRYGKADIKIKRIGANGEYDNIYLSPSRRIDYNIKPPK